MNKYHRNSREHGFWDNCTYPMLSMFAEVELPLIKKSVEERIPEKLCLIHSEISEALECFRSNEMETSFIKNKIGNDKPVGFPTELADAVIRLYDLAGALGIDLDAEIEQKHQYNITRPHMHGGKRI